MKHNLKRLTALVLALAMCLSLLSATAWAADVSGEYTDDVLVAEAEEESSALETEDEAEAEEPIEEEAAEEQPQEEAPVEPEEAEEEVSAAEVEEAEEAEDEGDATVSAQATSGSCGDKATYTLDSAGKLTISGTGAIDYSAFASNDSIVTVVIQEGITAIRDFAFDMCENLTSVTIPDSVTSIGAYVFDECTSLTSVTIPDSVTSIGDGAFCECTSLTSVTIPDSVTSSIGAFAFGWCDSLTSVTIPNSVTSIGEGAFAWCEGLKSVTIGSGVTSIGDDAFCGCESLTSVTIPGSVTSIGECAFFYCIKLTSVTIPNSVTSIGQGAFDCCNSLTDVYYTGSKTKWAAISIGDYNDDLLAATIYYNYNLSAVVTLSSVSNTTSGVKVSWKALSGAVKYRVFRKTGSGSWTKVGDTTSTSYTDKTAKSGTTYKYTVRCINSSGTAYTSSYNTTGLTIKYLTAGKVSSLANTSKGITVKWSKVTGASGYYVYRKTSGGSYSKIATVKSGSTVSYTDTAVKSKNGTTYVYAVRPYSGSYTGSYAGKTIARLTGVSISSLTNVKTKKMTVKWGKNSKATGYQIQYSTSSSFSSYKSVYVTSYKTVSKTISSLTKNKKYYVRVRAYKTVSGTKYYSAWSSTKNVKISK